MVRDARAWFVLITGGLKDDARGRLDVGARRKRRFACQETWGDFYRVNAVEVVLRAPGCGSAVWVDGSIHVYGFVEILPQLKASLAGARAVC